MPKPSEGKPSARSRFVRAVHVESDMDRSDALDGYVLTATGRAILRRIAPACNGNASSHAWSLAGPYGTGKSAFAVFAANLFAPGKGAGPKQARQILEQADPELAGQLFVNGRHASHGLMPVAITGTREPIGRAILRGLDHSLTQVINGRGTGLVRDVRRYLQSSDQSKPVDVRKITDLLSATIDQVCTSASRLDGIFLIVDELGKLLEYANNQPAESDIAVLQSLAEFAARSLNPCLLLTILHRDFGAYANRLSSQDRAEWEKVRGCFEDIAFEEPAEEMLRLIGRALTSADGKQRRVTEVPPRAYEGLCETAWKLGLAPGSMTKTEFVSLLQDGWPLHPLVAVMLGNVFRKLGQNERSAFSFLYSSEPFGLNELLNMAGSGKPTLYAVDRLYDYLSHSVRDGLYATPQAKRWAEIETILQRQPDASLQDVFLIKAIGLINALGQSGRIQATADLLEFASQQVMSRPNISRDLKELVSRKVVVPRRYNGTFALWEGSDVDLEAQIRIARDRLDPAETTARLAARYFNPRPIVARRHSYRTGALRYFPIHFLNPSDLTSKTQALEGPSVCIVLPDTAADQEQVQAAIKQQHLQRRNDLLFCIPARRQDFSNTIRELACLLWVRENVAALDGDRTARRELAIQIEGVRRKISEIFDAILQPEDDGASCRWYFSDLSQVRLRQGRRCSCAKPGIVL